MLMSLSTARTPGEKAAIRKEQQSHRARLLNRVEKLQKRGLSPAKAQQLREQIDGYTLSLTQDFDVVPQQVDYLLSALEDLTPARHPLKGMRRARPAPRPDRASTDRQKAQEEAGDELAYLAGARVKRK